MSTRSGRIRPSLREVSPPRTRKGVSPPRSPGRSRKSSPPARSSSRKSPARKSPSRKPASKFPARKSPSRTTKEATETAAQKSPGKRPTIKSDISVTLQDVTKLDSYKTTRSRRTEYSIKDVQEDFSHLEKFNGVDSSFDSNDLYGLRNRKAVEEVAPRRSVRLREFETLPDIRRSLSKSLSKSISKSVSQSIDTYSDEEQSEEDLRKKKSESVTRKLHTPLRESVSRLAQVSSRWEFGGRIGCAILLLLLPAVIFSVVVACKKSCSAKVLLDLSTYKNVPGWVSWEALAIISTQYVAQALFALIPILGPKADRMDETGKKHCFNGLFTLLLTIIVLTTLTFFKVFDRNFLLNNYLRLAASSYILAVILSIVLYVKSLKLYDSKLNPYGNTGYWLYDFCVGREIHPFIKNFDVKLFVSRIANVNTYILASIIFINHGVHIPAEATNIENFKESLSKVQLKPTILVYSMMQIIYVLNFLMREHKITSTFFWHSEGLGYLQVVASALYPFYFTSISKYVVDSQLSLSTNILISASVLYVLGFFLMLVSNNIKHEFRTDPLQPRLSNLDSMPTFHGKKLLVSNLWGVLRHPNYAGDILIHVALSLPGVVSGQYMAAAPALLTIVLLLHRAWRDHARCRRRYGAAWERYCKRVPSVIIPKVL